METFTITKETPIEDVNKQLFPESKRLTFTFEIPCLVLSKDGDQQTTREGGRQQVEHEIEEWFSFEQQKDYPLGIQRLSMSKLGGRPVPVLDVNSIPTAADYLSQIGKRTLWAFTSTELPYREGQLPMIYEKPVFRNRRVWIVLP